MASPATQVLQLPAEEECDSDYGSDFSPEEQDIVNTLLSSALAPLEVVENNPILNDVEYHEMQGALRVPRVLGRERHAEHSAILVDQESTIQRAELRNKSYPAHVEDTPRLGEIPPEEAPDDGQPDTRSPLERFRSAPRKPLSVTDLVSPSWCELQYWYMLTIHGRKKATKSMKMGTAIHEQLESEIYTTIRVQVQTKEDVWGLKIWNMIQGLRTLEDIGYTRELHVWGTIDECVVNGIIDEVSFTCPDTELEAEIERHEKSSQVEIPAGQMTISDFFKASDGQSIADATRTKHRAKSSRAYICDVKTRSVSSLPKGGAFRPTKMQLMLYHRLLANLATDQVNFSAILEHFSLDGNAPFSDAFIAQIGSLNDGDVFTSSLNPTKASIESSSQDSMSVLLDNNSLNALWSLMIKRLQHVLPNGKASIGRVLKAEYRSSQTGEIMGVKTFPMEEKVLEAYVEKEMQWWKGQREAEGVAIEEAYKCQSCEYADNCKWRLTRVQEATKKARDRKKAMGEIKKSEV